MGLSTFTETMTSEAALRELLGVPGELVRRKQLACLDKHCQAFIGLSPFLLIATTNTDGGCDVSPRGDAPGFVQILDETTLVIPERPGNRRIDTLRNIIQTGRAGLIFLIPGKGETLRVNGRACVIRDEAILERSAVNGKRPMLGIGIEVEEAFLHCAKSIKRSKLWKHESWPELSTLPSIGQMFLDHTQIADKTANQLDDYLEEGYKRLY